MRTSLLCLLFTGFLSAHTHAALYADFEDLALAPGTYQDGATLTPAGSFISGGITFNNSYPGYYEGGFAYSNRTDNSVGGFANPATAFTGGGSASDGSVVPGSNYGVAYYSAPNPGFGYPGYFPTISLPAGESFVSLRVTNTSYAGISMRDGDGFAKKFGGPSGDDPDYFKLTISGYDNSNNLLGFIDIYLADFRFANNALDYIVDDWTSVDLTPLGANARSIQLTFDSTDIGPFGINTPTYAAIDNVQTVPEPSTALLACAGFAALALRRKR